MIKSPIYDTHEASIASDVVFKARGNAGDPDICNLDVPKKLLCNLSIGHTVGIGQLPVPKSLISC